MFLVENHRVFRIELWLSCSFLVLCKMMLSAANSHRRKLQR